MHAEVETPAPSGTGAEAWIEALETEGRAEAEARRLRRAPDEPTSESAELELGSETSAPEGGTVVLVHEDQRVRDAEDDMDVPAREEAVADRLKKRHGLFRRGGD